MRSWEIGVYVGLAAVAFFWTRAAAASTGGGPVSGGTTGGGTPPPNTGRSTPLAVGPYNSPEIAALLIELNDVLASAGVNMATVSAREITTMRKAPGQPVAIPPRSDWPLVAATMRDLYDPIRAVFDGPLNIYNGYRPEDYNTAVGGVPNSRHMRFALDILPTDSTAVNRKRLAFIAADVFKRNSGRLGMGFGVYGEPSFPTGVHVDLGRSSPATWGVAQYFLDNLGTV